MVRIVEMRCGKWCTRNSFEAMPRAGLLTREGFCKGVFSGYGVRREVGLQHLPRLPGEWGEAFGGQEAGVASDWVRQIKKLSHALFFFTTFKKSTIFAKIIKINYHGR